MKVKKFLYAFATAVASFATCGLYAEIIVPDEPVNLVRGRDFITSALYDYENNGAKSFFDGNAASRFITNPKPDPNNGVTPTAIIHFQDGALTINAYRVCGHSTEGTQDRYPKAWALFGSNDGGETWVKLDERSEQTKWSKGESRQFTFDNIESYSSFKFEILANNGNSTYTVIGELELFSFERTDLLEVGYSGYRVGTPTPFYGVVSGNTVSQFGGGVFIENGAIRNCLVTCNTNNNSGSTYGGGGIFCRRGVSVVNCTVTKNVAYHGQGIWIDGTFGLRNSIISHNVHYRPTGVVTNVYGWGTDGVRVGGEAGSIYNSCVNDECYLAYPAFSNNHSIVADPMFVDAANGDYHLRVGSPCVNGGAKLDYTAESLDLDGNPRVFNFGKRSSKPDMGCYESPWGIPGMMLRVR